jgi:ABC-type bacteriocin/lantibiotic exporter with double-glycine peptidase domain
MVRFIAEIQNMMTSSQRIYQYTQLETEDELVKPKDAELIKAGWPSKGFVKFDKLSMRYREFLDPSIRGLSCDVDPGMKIGIVGRTGAGKSSILQVLFRLTEPFEGSLNIDGTDC